MSAEGGDVLTDGQVENLNLEDDIVNPWEVASKSATGVDYDKLISKCYAGPTGPMISTSEFWSLVQRYIKSRDLNLLFIIDIFSHYDRRIGQSGADRRVDEKSIFLSTS